MKSTFGEPLKQRVRRLKAQDYSASILVPPLVERDVMANRMNIAVSPFEGRADVERGSAGGLIGLSDHLLIPKLGDRDSGGFPDAAGY